MPDTKRSLSSLQTLLADNTAGDITPQHVRDFLVSTFPVVLPPPQGRITTESGVAVSITDRTAQSTIYYTPYNGNGIWLYNGTIWQPYAFTERSLALSGLTSAKNYDVFIYDNAGTLTLELSAAWTNDTTRADAITTQDGVRVKSGATTRRYVGTIRTTATTTTEDSLTKRFVWNNDNSIIRSMLRNESTSFWAYSSQTVRSANNSSANRVEFVCGFPTLIRTSLVAWVSIDQLTGGELARAGIGLDTTTAFGGQLTCAYITSAATTGLYVPFASTYQDYLSGYHYLSWNEAGAAGSACNFVGTFGGTQSGINGTIIC